MEPHRESVSLRTRLSDGFQFPCQFRARPESRPALNCESQLRVAAAMLRHARPGEITATTVVGVLGRDDTDAFNALLAEIENEQDLDANVRLHVGSYSVRFTRREIASS